MRKLSEKDIEEMNRAFLALKTRRDEVPASEFAQAIKWKVEETIEALKAIFDNPEKYQTLFYVLLSADNKVFLR